MEGGDRALKEREEEKKKASRGGRWPDDTAVELGGPVSYTRAGSFLFSKAEGGERRHGRAAPAPAAASVLAQVRR